MPVASPSHQVAAWLEGVRRTAAAVGTINQAVAEVVDTVAMLLDTDGWSGEGISSPAHWLSWQGNLAYPRARGLVRIARRRDELPECWAAFRAGRLTEDAMVRIARRCPAEEDATAASWGAKLTIAQLTRALSGFPVIPDPDARERVESERTRFVDLHTDAEGWVRGQLQLPPDEGAVLAVAMSTARSAELRDREGLAPDAELAPGAERQVDNADAFVRLCSEGLDGLDATLQRTGHRGERCQVVLHHQVAEDGSLGPGRLHLGTHVPEAVARYLACDADVVHVLAKEGRIVGITPTERTPNRRLRRALEHRDGGCAHPLCGATRWLHAHHLQHWEDGGPTVPSNLVSLCPKHHRSLHHGDFAISGDPELGTLAFTDAQGRPIAPPELGATTLPPPTEPHQYERPLGQPLRVRDWIWN